jgi:hypothetical protein
VRSFPLPQERSFVIFELFKAERNACRRNKGVKADAIVYPEVFGGKIANEAPKTKASVLREGDLGQNKCGKASPQRRTHHRTRQGWARSSTINCLYLFF